jgi:creatinine amidohydrolase/Fe(II)-dependent formamide hydrolase-like protein
VTRRTLAHLTVADVAEHVERSPRVLVPVGSTEQHGTHAPLGTDAILATAVCERVAPRVDALVAPAIPFGVSPEHEGFAGLVTLTPRTMIALAREVSVSLARGGFKRIVLVNGHYTNVVALHAAVMEASDAAPHGTAVYWLSYWDALPPEQRDAYLGDEAGLHANVGETSAVMAVDESLVRLDRAQAEYPAFPRPVGRASVEAYFFSGRGALRRVLPGGVWGDPREASAERGRVYLDQIEDAVVAAIEETEALFVTYGTAPPP